MDNKLFETIRSYIKLIRLAAEIAGYETTTTDEIDRFIIKAPKRKNIREKTPSGHVIPLNLGVERYDDIIMITTGNMAWEFPPEQSQAQMDSLKQRCRTYYPSIYSISSLIITLAENFYVERGYMINRQPLTKIKEFILLGKDWEDATRYFLEVIISQKQSPLREPFHKYINSPGDSSEGFLMILRQLKWNEKAKVYNFIDSLYVIPREFCENFYYFQFHRLEEAQQNFSDVFEISPSTTTYPLTIAMIYIDPEIISGLSKLGYNGVEGRWAKNKETQEEKFLIDKLV